MGKARKERYYAAKSEQYADIPGTYLFDKHNCAKGYHLNMMCMSMMKEENRKAFLADPAAYLNRFPLSEAQRQAVLERNWLKMIQEGANIYYMSKLGATCGFSFEDMAASMTGNTKESYRKMMLAGGRPLKGNRSRRQQARANAKKKGK
jgi:protocatechuate 4,5-dioxygenase alpha subunit